MTNESMTLRPLAAGDEAELLRIHQTPEVTHWWDVPDEDFPWDEPESTRFTIEVEGVIAGLIQFGEEPEPMYRHAWIDIFVDPEGGRRGTGTDAIVTLVRHLTEDLAHHRITIDPSLDNAAAVGCYEKAGFRRVGVMEAAERDPLSGRWRDALMMELVVRPHGP